MSQHHLKVVMTNALNKLKISADYGPGGKSAELTSEESMLVYRMLTEQLGFKHK